MRPNHAAGTAIVCLAFAALLALTGCQDKVVVERPASDAQTVTATGSGTASAKPDQAVMSFGVTKEAKNAKDALAGASQVAEKIGAAVKKAGVDAKDIQTQSVNIYPTTDQRGRITGYQSSLSVSVKVRDLEALSDVISAATNAGADNVSGPTFDVADDTSYREQAIDDAVADARKSAEAMAKAADKTVGQVVRISTREPEVGPLPMYDSAALRAEAGVPIEPGQLDVISNVTVVFELK